MLAYDEVVQEKHQCDNIVLLEENRLQAATRAARYQQALRHYHSRRVHARCFEEGDLVLRCIKSAKRTNKLSPKWKALTGWYESPDLAQSIWRPEMALNCKTHGILSISASSTCKARLSSPAWQPPIVHALPQLHVTPCTSQGDDPVQERNN